MGYQARKRHGGILNANYQDANLKSHLYSLNHKTFWKRQNYGENKKISGVWGWREKEEGWAGGAQRRKYSVWYSIDGCMSLNICQTYRLGEKGEGDDRGWDSWMASLTQWPWVWVSFGSYWWTGRPGVLQFMGSQRVRHNWATELNWTELIECTRVSLLWTINFGWL